MGLPWKRSQPGLGGIAVDPTMQHRAMAWAMDRRPQLRTPMTFRASSSSVNERQNGSSDGAHRVTQILSTLDLISTPAWRTRSVRENLADLVAGILHDARMRVAPRIGAWVMELIGEEVQLRAKAWAWVSARDKRKFTVGRCGIRKVMDRYSATERIGVNAVERIVVSELGWIFREQPIVDMGIDAQIELVENGIPTGKLVALQIKSGASHFRNGPEAYTYYGDLTHLEYWLDHALPVVLIAYLPEFDETLWVHVTAHSVVRTKKAWRVSIPKKNKLGPDTKHLMEKVFEGTPAQQRLRKLSIDLPLMRHINAGSKVSVELEDWINKSLGRTTIEVFVDDEVDETHSQKWPMYFGGYGMKELAEMLFPWADASIDEEFYEQNDERRGGWEEARDRAADIDNGISEPGAADVITDEYPYAERGGEVEVYRFKLDLNEVGEAFLVLSDYMDGSVPS
jgi:hypothetical protein